MNAADAWLLERFTWAAQVVARWREERPETAKAMIAESACDEHYCRETRLAFLTAFGL